MDVFGWEWEVDNILIRTCYREVPAILQTSLSCQLICSAATKEFARILDTGNKHQRAQGHVPIWTGLKKMSSRKLLPFHPSQVCFQTFGNQKCNQPYWEKKRVKVGLYGLVSFKILKVSVEAGEELIMRIGFLNILQTLLTSLWLREGRRLVRGRCQKVVKTDTSYYIKLHFLLLLLPCHVTNY